MKNLRGSEKFSYENFSVPCPWIETKIEMSHVCSAGLGQGWLDAVKPASHHLAMCLDLKQTSEIKKL